jgi:hypothetical protein
MLLVAVLVGEYVAGYMQGLFGMCEYDSDKDVVLVVSPRLETSKSRSHLVDNVNVLNDLHFCDWNRMSYFDRST